MATRGRGFPLVGSGWGELGVPGPSLGVQPQEPTWGSLTPARPQDGDKFWRMPECYIRGSTIKYLRIPDEVIDMVKEEAGAKGRGRGGLQQHKAQKGRGLGGAGRGTDTPDGRTGAHCPPQHRGRPPTWRFSACLLLWASIPIILGRHGRGLPHCPVSWPLRGAGGGWGRLGSPVRLPEQSELPLPAEPLSCGAAVGGSHPGPPAHCSPLSRQVCLAAGAEVASRAQAEGSRRRSRAARRASSEAAGGDQSPAELCTGETSALEHEHPECGRWGVSPTCVPPSVGPGVCPSSVTPPACPGAPPQS